MPLFKSDRFFLRKRMNSPKQNHKLRISNTGTYFEVIDQEIAWCRENKEIAGSEDFANGFISGLMQAKYLINVTNIAMKEIDETPLSDFREMLKKE
jgi:hypothetical protein